VLVRTRDPHDDTNATARGTLASTPLVHVLVYVLDHRLSGMVTLREPDGVLSTIAFGAGSPEKVRSGRPAARLGEVLASHGLVSSERATAEAEAARRVGSLVGELLVARGALSRESLHWGLRQQVVEKLARLVNAPVETRYSFHRDVNALKHWPTIEAFPANPLDAILACVRVWEDRAHMQDMLGRIATYPLCLHPAAELDRLALTDDEQALVGWMRREQPTLTDLRRERGADDPTVASLVYAFAVTRQLVLPGQKGEPMGFDAAGPVSVRAGDRMTPVLARTPPPPPVQPSAPVVGRVAEEPVDGDDVEAERALRSMEDLRLADAALNRGEVATAQRLAESAVAGSPEDPDARALVAWLRSVGGQAQAIAYSMAELGRILDDDPTHERSLLYRGRIHKRSGKAREAKVDFESLLEINPRHNEAASELRLLRSKRK
jgi:hypothetical protein